MPFYIHIGGGPSFDADAAAYIAAVEDEDDDTLEAGVKTAINDFVVGCKADGIWSAIKASCILAGARTLNGALVPLVGAAPTNVNFVTGDYNRKTGLIGNGTSKYLISGFVLSDFPDQDDASMSVYVTEAVPGTGKRYAGGRPDFNNPWQIFVSGSASTDFIRIWLGGGAGNDVGVAASATETGLVGASRNGTNLRGFAGKKTGTATRTVVGTRGSEPVFIFTLANPDGTPTADYIGSRISFYELGGNLNETHLATRVSALMTALDTAIT